MPHSPRQFKYIHGVNGNMSGFQPDVFGSSPNGCTKFTTKGLYEPFLVVLAQLVELLIVGQEGMGSRPIGHPKYNASWSGWVGAGLQILAR